MHTHATNGRSPSVGAAAKEVADHARSLVRLELELAGLELKRKISALAIAIGLLVGAAVLGLFALGFALATVAAAPPSRFAQRSRTSASAWPRRSTSCAKGWARP